MKNYFDSVHRYSAGITALLLLLFCTATSLAQTPSNKSGWHLINYSFKDGSLQKETTLAGSTSKMKDVISYKGNKGNIEISQNRYDVKTGKLLAGVTYKVVWADPPAVMSADEKSSFDYELSTLSSLTWKVPQQTMHLNQGADGIYFVTPDGTKYITKDVNTTLTTEKAVARGTKGAKRVIQLTFGNGFAATYYYEWREVGSLEPPIAGNTNSIGWLLTSYSFKDGSLQKETTLAGSTSKMKDVISYKGNKGNIEISQNRYDVKTGKLLAGVTYKVVWADPPAVMHADEKSSFDYSLSTLSSLTWKVPQQTMHLNQGADGIYFITPDGTKYITKDVNTTLTTEKVVARGTKGAKRVIQLTFGNGFAATYYYEWQE